MITRASLSSIAQGMPKYRSMLAGNEAYDPGAFIPIATALGDGSSASVVFSSIPQTYKHLELRCISKQTSSTTSWVTGDVLLNSDTGNNYTYHRFYGSGSSVIADGYDTSASSRPILMSYTSSGTYSNMYGVSIMNIMDYSSTVKKKNIKILTGGDSNSSSYPWVIMFSSLWNSTSAINSITLNAQGGYGNWATGTRFALYGIKG